MARRRRPQPPPPDSQPVAKRHVKQFAKRILDSAIDKALEFFWLGVIAVMTSTAIALGLYIKSGRATWVYPYLNFALGFICACLFLVVAASLLFYLQARRRKAAEQVKNLKFVSQEKGFIDFIGNKQKAQKEIDKILIAVVKEIQGFGETTTKFGSRLNPNTPFPERQRLASKTAANLNKQSAKLESQLESFQTISDVLIESEAGFIKWLNPALEDQKAVLIQNRQSSSGSFEGIRTARLSLSSFRNSVAGIRGASQDLNTASARLCHVLDGLADAFRKTERHYEGLVKMIDGKIGN